MKHSSSQLAVKPRTAGLLLLKAFVEEHRFQLVSAALLGGLAGYVCRFSPERLFDFLVFIVLWLQLELAYRQWWSEARRRRPRLALDRVSADSLYLYLYVKNSGEVPVYSVNVALLTIPGEEYEKYRPFLAYLAYGGSLKEWTVKRLLTLARASFEYETYLPPGLPGVVKVELNEIVRYGGNEVLFLFICYDEPLLRGVEACSEAVRITFSEGNPLATRYCLEEGAPGVLTKLPNMLRDALAYYRVYKAYSLRFRRAQPGS